jgi:hypothetical protein
MLTEPEPWKRSSGLSPLSARNAHKKGRAFSLGGLYPEVSMVLLDNSLTDGEPQPPAFSEMGFSGSSSIKRVKKMCLLLGRKCGTIIMHLEKHMSPFHADAERDHGVFE